MPSFLEGTLGLCIAGGLVAYALNSASSTGALLEVQDNHAAAIVSARTGDVTTTDTPGYKVLKPFFEDAYRVVKSPVEYVMKDNLWENHNKVPRLAVRAADGSNVWFNEVRIQYAVDPERAWDVMRDSGGEYTWHNQTMDAYARAVLRDAFGRYNAEEIVRQENLREAKTAAKARLDEVLKPHGLVVLELTTTSPAFPKTYESVVQRRQVAEQETQKLDAQLEQLRSSRQDRLAKLERDKSLEETRMRSKVALDLSKARRDAMLKRSKADRDYESKLRAGERERDERVSRADSESAAYRSEAQGMRERAEAMAAQGAMAVRRALIETMGKVQFEVAPFESTRPGSNTASHTSFQGSKSTDL